MENVSIFNSRYHIIKEVRTLCGEIDGSRRIPSFNFVATLFKKARHHPDTSLHALKSLHGMLQWIETCVDENSLVCTERWQAVLDTVVALSMGQPNNPEVEWPKTLKAITLFKNQGYQNDASEYGLRMATVWKMEIATARPDLAVELGRMMATPAVTSRVMIGQRLWQDALFAFGQQAGPAPR